MLKPALASLWMLAASAQAADIVPLSCPEQTYPPEALRYEMEGATALQLLLDQDGKPSETKVLKSSGNRLLDRESMNHASRCRFNPAAQAPGARPTLTITWQLPNGQPDVKPRFMPRSCLNPYKIFKGDAVAPNEGGVSVWVQVWPDGRPYTPKVEPVGSDPEIKQLAAEYIENCRFEPAQRGGQPVQGAALVQLPVHRELLSEQALRARYDKIAASFAGKLEYKSSHILFKEEGEAREALAEIRNGADFATIAKTRSLDPGSGKVGGALPWARAEVYVKNFASALRSQAIGELGVVKSEFGWHIVRVEESRPVIVPPFESVRERLRASLLKETDTVVQAPPAPNGKN